MPYGKYNGNALPIEFNLLDEDAITQNRYWRREFALYYLDDEGNEQLWELEGAVSGAYCTVKPSYDEPYVIFAHTSNGKVILGDASDGFSFAIELQHTDTNSLDDWGTGVWDIYILDSGRQIPLYFGTAEMLRNAT